MSTITSTGIIAGVVALALAVAVVGAQVADAHRAQVAADLAAVAGATAHYQGFDACGVASLTASLNGAAVTSCRMVGGDVVVAVEVRRATAEACAGPA